jgi:branched-chain amino acid transport system permease protein
MISPEFLCTQLLIGIMTGAIIAIIATGLSLIFGVMEGVNVAYGEMLAMGGYVAYIITINFSLSPFLGMLCAFFSCFIFGILVDTFMLNQLRLKVPAQERLVAYTVLTLGLSIFLQNSYLAIWGYYYLFPKPLVEGTVRTPLMTINIQRVINIGMSLAMLACLYIFLQKTRTGRAIRASAQNPDAAQALGVDIKKIYALTFGIGCAMAGMAGSIVTPVLAVFPWLGLNWIWKGFASIVIAGMKNLIGVLICSFLVGITEAIGYIFLPINMVPIISFTMMMIIMFIKPTGLFGEKRII